MFCKYCGNEVPDDASCCHMCGKDLTGNKTKQMNTFVQIADEKKGMATASLILGVVGLIAWMIPLFGFPIAIVGLVFGLIGIKEGGKGMAIAGIVLASVSLLGTTANSAIGFYRGYNGELRFQQENVSEDVKKEDIQSERESKVYKVSSDSKLTKDDMESIVYNLEKRAESYTTEGVVLMKKRKSEWYVEISMPGNDDAAYEKVVCKPDMKFVGGYGTCDEEVIVTNQNIESALSSVVEVENSSTDNRNYVVKIIFDAEGTKAFAEGTEKYIGSPISIVLDGEVISEPIVQDVITGGEVQITASSYEEAENLATLLRVGNLGFELVEVK